MKNFNLEQYFREFVAKEKLFTTKDRLLLAVSGGIDSVVLCHLCFVNNYLFEIAHCNFKLRGDESDGDAAFVRDLAAKYKVEYCEKVFDTEAYAKENKLSIQVAARELRYNWFKDLRQTKASSAKYILTAHHADDNVETILMNFFKGTGIAGLKGILPKKGNIIRPILFARKKDILSYASDNQLTYREDSSNASEKYARNFFRNNLIPSIEKVFPAVTENISANAERFRDIKWLYDEAVGAQNKKLVFKKGEEVHLPVLKLLQSKGLTTILFEIIKDYGFTALQTQDVVNLLESETGKYVNSSTHRIYRYNKWLIISLLQSQTAASFLIEEQDSQVSTKEFSISFSQQTMPAKFDGNKDVAMLDDKKITYPLILRKWKAGDYFYPLGMSKKKKVGRFLSDEKMTLSQKENTWVIESGKKIIWIVGRRIDERFKITDQTRTLLKIYRRPAE